MILTEPQKESEAVLQLPGVVATKTALTVFDSTSEQQMHRAFAQIAKMEKSVAWWLGDLGIAIQERKQRELVAQAAALRAEADACSDDEDGRKAARRLEERATKLERTQVEYSSVLCEMHGVDRGYLHNCVSLCRSIPASHRNETLTPKHHQAALLARGTKTESSASLSKVVEWLDLADEKKLTASQLRMRVRQAHATFKAPTIGPQPQQFKELDLADAWCMRNPTPVFNQAEAECLLSRWQALAEWMRKLSAMCEGK